jgi:hypothetical protein
MNPELHGYEPTPEMTEISEKLIKEALMSQTFQDRLSESLRKYDQMKRELVSLS